MEHYENALCTIAMLVGAMERIADMPTDSGVEQQEVARMAIEKAQALDKKDEARRSAGKRRQKYLRDEAERMTIFEDIPCPGCGRTDVHPDQATCQSEAWADEWYCSEACYIKHRDPK